MLTDDMSPAPAGGTLSRSAGNVHAQQQVARWSSARRPGPGPGARSGRRFRLQSRRWLQVVRCICCLPWDTALPDGATSELSGFARIPWLDVGVRFFGSGSLLKRVIPALMSCLRTQTLGSSGKAGQGMRQPGPRQRMIVCVHCVWARSRSTTSLSFRFHRGG